MDLQQFGSIADLIHRQQTPGGDAAQRNAVLQALTIEAQAPEPTAQLASTVAILALWPGLDGVHGRLCRDFPEGRADHGGDIITHVAIAIRNMDIVAVNRIAATLVMNAERDLRRALIAHRNRCKSELSIESAKGSAALAVPACDDLLISVEAWRDLLAAILGRDTNLFLRIIVLGETQAEAIAAVGLSHDVGRKRHQRGMAKLRIAADNRGEMSHSATKIGFYPSETRETRK